MREATRQLSWKYGHIAGGQTGIADYAFAQYQLDGEPAGLSLAEWLRLPGRDPKSLLENYHSSRPRRVLERLLGRE